MIKETKEKIKQRIIAEYKNFFPHDKVEEKDLRHVIHKLLDDLGRREDRAIGEADRKIITNELIDEFIGLGPIEALLKDPDITEIMINGPSQVYVEKFGKKELSSIKFDDDQQLMYFVHKILSPTRRRVDESFPYTDLSLEDGSRVNIIIPPLALNGAVVTIRRFSDTINTVDDLIKLGTLDQRISDFLIGCIKIKANIVFAGATGAGKTTTLNVFSSYISSNERIITIEDTAELRLNQEHVVRLEARQPNIEGKGEIGIRELFKNSLRMRPERIIIGEIRGAESLDMLQAICSGHRGSLAIIHANSPQDVIYRLETMILTSGVPVNLETIHRQIAAALDIVVYQEQLLDGSRKITRIAQISGMKAGEVILEDIFVFVSADEEKDGLIGGRWVATGVLPKFYDKFKKAKVNFSEEMFRQ